MAPYCCFKVAQCAADCSKAGKQKQQKWQQTGVSVWTHGYVVDGHAHGSMVIDLLRGDRLRLIGQKNPQEQQQTLVAINYT